MKTFSRQDYIDFVVLEARLIDEQRFDEWLAMFADDGHYWLPLEYGQTDPRLQSSLLYEDRLLLKMRVERLKGARTFSQRPKSRSHHVLQMPTIDAMDEAGEGATVHTPMHYVETRQDEQSLYAAWAKHHLKVVDNEIKIKLKRVDIINTDAHFRSIQLFM
jgi:3-phenylpropionate/cinnamic acid dioxygenase small subunit